jgi:hypothetical protein
MWAPSEESLTCCIQKSGEFGIAQGLVSKFYSIGSCLHQVCERSNVDSWVDIGIHLEKLCGTIYTGAGW